MALSKTRNYLLLNYCQSPVAVNTRYDSFLIPGGTEDDPGSMPFTIDEMSVINNKTKAIRIGLLWPEDDFKEEIYEELRIPNWRNIMTDSEIRDIILNPTIDGMQKIINIDNDAYFERIRGIYIGLRNSGHDISNKVVNIMEARRQEFAKNQRNSRIVLTPHEKYDANDSRNDELKAMKEQMAAMQELLNRFMSQSATVSDNNETAQAASSGVTQKQTEPAKRSRAKAKTE